MEARESVRSYAARLEHARRTNRAGPRVLLGPGGGGDVPRPSAPDWGGTDREAVLTALDGARAEAVATYDRIVGRQKWRKYGLMALGAIGAVAGGAVLAFLGVEEGGGVAVRGGAAVTILTGLLTSIVQGLELRSDEDRALISAAQEILGEAAGLRTRIELGAPVDDATIDAVAGLVERLETIRRKLGLVGILD